MKTLVTFPENGTHTRRVSDRESGPGSQSMPMLLTVDDAAEVLRTTKRAIYAMVERRQLPGIIRIGRRVLFRGDLLLHWLNQKSASSLRSEQR
jgi:excisionase family DNA binding protein